MSKRPAISIQLPADVAAALASVAEDGGQSPAELAASIITTWVGDSRDLANAVNAAGELTGKGSVAAHRLNILHEWRVAIQSRRRGTPIDDATDEYLARLAQAGETITRGTLYSWKRQWAASGIDGLIDGRKGSRGTIAGEFLSEVLKIYRSKRSPVVSQCYREALATAERLGWNTVGYRAAFYAVRRAMPSMGSKRPIEAPLKNVQTSAGGKAPTSKKRALTPRRKVGKAG